MRASRQPDPHPPPPEAFGSSEESFERRRPFTETRNLSEERFERSQPGSSKAWDLEEQFEHKPRRWEAETTHDTSFDRQPAYSEVDFHDRYRDLAESPYEFHSPLEKKSEEVKTPPPERTYSDRIPGTEAPQPLTRSSIASRLKGSKSLRETALLAEILGPPMSRRQR